MGKLIIAASLTGLFLELFGVSWDAVDRKITSEFPDVSFIYREELLQAYENKDLNVPLLIDVREPREFAVSRLPGAINLQSAQSISMEIADRDQPIVVYCSVGYRSAAVAAELQSLGYSQVWNLQHSIFGWGNAGAPLENADGGTKRIHPYNSAWGKLLDESLRAYSP